MPPTKVDAVILAAKPSSYGVFAPTLFVDNKPIIQHIVTKLQKSENINKIIIITGSNTIPLYNGVEYLFNPEWQKGPCKSIKLGLSHTMTRGCIVLHGDIWFKNLRINNICKKNTSCVVTTNCKFMKPKEIGVKINDDNVLFGWRQKTKWGKILFIHPDDRFFFDNILLKNIDSWFSFEIIEAAHKQGIKLSTYNHKDLLFDIDCHQDLRKIYK